MTTQQRIKLSKDTLQILKNFSDINNTMSFSVGSNLKIVSPSESIAAVAVIPETFPVDFSIYEMNRFLNVLSLSNMADAELVFGDDKKVIVQCKQTKVDYYFSSKRIVDATSGKTPAYPSADFVTILDADTLDGLEKAASVLGHKYLKIVAKDGKGTLIATSPDIDTSNDYVIELADVFAHPLIQGENDRQIPDVNNKIPAPDGEYLVKFENIRNIPGSYQLTVANKQMAGFKHLERSVHYFVGLESL